MTLRVAVVTEFCPPYRTGFYEMLADKYEVRIFFCNSKESWRAYGDFDYSELSGYLFRDRYKITPTVFTHLYRFDPDVIVGAPVEGFGGQSSFLYARATNTPFVLWTGEWHLPLTTLRTVTFPLIRRIYMESDAIAVYGPHISDYLVDLGVEEDKISIAWNTVDTGQFSTFNQDRVADLRKEWGIPDDASVALFVGRLVKEKGVKYLLDAYKTARAVSEKPTYLLIVGDGDQRTELTEQVDDDHDVIFTGYINNELLPEYYALADVFVLPSVVTAEFREPWGLVINEAMSSGTAVITTGQVGASCIIDEGKNGFVVPERNEAALADRLAEIFENPTMASEMGVQAKKDSKLYDYERMLDGFDEAVQTAVVRSKNNG
ncbi:hypothetical protein HAL_11790 [Haladaptatus sp. T7]|nr:hypothetical protein HAL_11790 [Haladaptatus sp. T7]